MGSKCCPQNTFLPRMFQTFELFLLHLLWIVKFPGHRLRNFEIRVGQGAFNLGNNRVCYQQLSSMESGLTANSTCWWEVYGSWVSVNKSDSESGMEFLQLREIRVFGIHGHALTPLCQTVYVNVVVTWPESTRYRIFFQAPYFISEWATYGYRHIHHCLILCLCNLANNAFLI